MPSAGWSTDEQEQFIALILPHIRGKRLKEKEVDMIRLEAQEAGLPDSCVDRLLAESHTAYLKKRDARNQSRKLKAHHRNKEFDAIDDVDESDNILAYFSRMASLKTGGHFPRLNTDALESFVERQDEKQAEEEIEMDFDVGYVNRTFDRSLDESFVQEQTNSWDDNTFDAQSLVSKSTIEGRCNRYDVQGNDEEEVQMPVNLFESLLVGGASSPTADTTSRHVTWDNTIIQPKESAGADESTESILVTVDENPQDVDTSALSKSLDLATTADDDPILSQRQKTQDRTAPNGSIRSSSALCYGYEKDEEEWTRKQTIAIWQPHPQNNGSLLKAFSCQANAEDVVAEELRRGLLARVETPARLGAMTAVRRMMAQTEERLKLQKQINERRHVPDESAAAPKMWSLPYVERCVASPGYMGVDQYSLMESTAVQQSSDPRDVTPWELRDVKQHFLYDNSAVERNWFGRIRRKRGNDPYKYRPSRVRSMEMPVEGSDASSAGCSDTDCEWTEAGANSKTNASKTTVASKTTLASKSCKSNDGSNSGVNRTATLSFTSGEQTEHDGDDEKSRHYGRGDQSMTTRSVNDGASTLHTEDYPHDGESTLFTSEMNLATLAAEVNDTFNSFLGLSPKDASMSMDADDIGSTGISDILDADERSDDEVDDMFNSRYEPTVVQPTVVQTFSNDRYMSSFSQTSTAISYNTDDHSISATGSHSSDSQSSSGSSCSSSSGSSSSFRNSDDESRSSDYSDGTWEDAPECGTLTNVKPKLGERVSRVSPDHTSHLLRSRFRKKYFPRGSFPYDAPPTTQQQQKTTKELSNQKQKRSKGVDDKELSIGGR